jgi:hypothetical protein
MISLTKGLIQEFIKPSYDFSIEVIVRQELVKRYAGGGFTFVNTQSNLWLVIILTRGE